jgi:Zn finger protein HypA/HybF involved in hydrogenase expression
MIDRYTIHCRKCGDDVALMEIESDAYRCPICQSVYATEDGVFDKVIAIEMHQLYLGAKKAGLLYDKELDDNYNRR